MLVFNPEILAKSIDTENNEIVIEDLFMIEKSEKSNPDDPKFEYFKKLVLDHLAELEKKENKTIAKAIDICEYIQKSKFPVGTVRNWNGGKFKKISPNKWVRVYDKETRGAKLAIAALRRKAAACTSSDELLQLVLANKERFVDNAGKPLPFMQEFSAYVSGLNDKNAAKETKTAAKTTPESKESPKETSDKYGFTDIEKKDLKQLFENFMNHKTGKLNFNGFIEQLDLSAKSGNKILHKINKQLCKENGLTLAERTKLPAGSLNNALQKLYDDYIKEEYPLDFEDKKESAKPESKEEPKSNHKVLSKEKIIAEYNRLGKELAQQEKENRKLYDKNNGWNKGLTDNDMNPNSDYQKWLKGGVKLRELMSQVSKLTDSTREGYSSEDRREFLALHDIAYNGKMEDSETVNTKEETKPENKETASKKGIEAIRDKYQSSKSIEGDEDEIYVGKETITGKWKLVEADAPSASHDEITFHKTEGFPTGKDGATVNDRDYEHDTAAQEAVIDIASDYDGRALGLDSPVIVTQDGVVTSGNNRTMSSKIAARKGTDTKYIEALKKRAGKFGFTADDVAQFKHPRVVFETEHKGDYTTSEFAKFNESGKKAMNPVEKAVKVSKLIKPQTIEQIAENISEFDTMGDLYADKKATRDIFNTLIESDIIQKTDLPQYYADNAITAAGKEFLETVLIGSVVDENNIRQLNTEGGKSIRQKLVRAITPLIENKGMKGYSINKELNEAVGIAVEVAHNKDKFADVEDYSKQTDMFRKLDPVSIELAKKLEGTQKGFAEFMLEMNGGLRPAANGEADIFLGGTESKEDIVNRILHIKKAVQKALKSFINHIFDK